MHGGQCTGITIMAQGSNADKHRGCRRRGSISTCGDGSLAEGFGGQDGVDAGHGQRLLIIQKSAGHARANVRRP